MSTEEVLVGSNVPSRPPAPPTGIDRPDKETAPPKQVETSPGSKELPQVKGVYDYEGLISLDIEPPRFAVEGLLVEGQVGFLAGRFSIGKTLFSLQLNISMATGRDFLGRKVAKPYRIAFLDTENGACEVRSRIGKQVAAFSLDEDEQRLLNDNWVFVDCCEEGALQYLKLDADGFDKLSRFVGEHGVEILIVDNFGQVFPWEEQDEKHIKLFFSNLRKLRGQHPSLQSGVILFLHHMTKPTESNQFSLLTSPYEYLSRSRGSGRILDFSPIRLALAEETTIGGDTIYIVNGFVRSGEVSPLILERNPDTLCFELNADKDLVSKKVFSTSPRKLELYNLLPAHFTFEQAAQLQDRQGKVFSRRTVDAMLKVACANDLVRKTSDGSYERTAKEPQGEDILVN